MKIKTKNRDYNFNFSFPTMPLTYPYNPFNTPGTNDPNTPPWTVTCSYSANKNFTDK